MAIATFPLTVDVGDLLEEPFDHAYVIIRTNLPVGTVIAYGEDGEIKVPGGRYPAPSGVATFNLPTKTGATNVSAWQYVIVIEVGLPGRREIRKLDPIYIDAPSSTSAVNVATHVDASSVPPTMVGQAISQINAAVGDLIDEAEGYATAAQQSAEDAAGAVAGVVAAVPTLSIPLPHVVNQAALLPWYRRLASAKAAAAHVLVTGDSLSEGTGSTLYDSVWPHRLQDMIRARVGVTGGLGYMTATPTNGTIPSLATQVGTATMGGWGLGGRSMSLHDTSTHHVTYADVECDRVRIWYGKTDYLGGGLKVKIDDVDQSASISSNAVANSDGHYWDSAPLTPGPHTVRIESTSAFIGIFNGADFYLGDYGRGVRVYNGAHFGYTSASFLTANMTTGSWAHAAATDPDLHVIYVGTNDLIDGSTPETFSGRIDSLLEKIPDVPTVLVGGFLRSDALAQAARWNDMKEILAGKAGDHIAYIDIAPWWPDLADDANGYGLHTDGVHLSDAGAGYLAHLVASLVCPDVLPLRA